VEREVGEERPLAGAAERQRAPVAHGLDGSKDPELQQGDSWGVRRLSPQVTHGESVL